MYHVRIMLLKATIKDESRYNNILED